MQITIRNALESDLGQIVEILNQAIRTHNVGFIRELNIQDRREWFKEHTPDDYPILVAECDKKVAGWISISPYRKGRDALDKTVEVSYFIHDDYQRKGVGSALLLEIINLSKILGKSTMIAIIFHSNTGSVKILEKHNFEVWGIMPEVAEIEGEKYNHVYYGKKL